MLRYNFLCYCIGMRNTVDYYHSRIIIQQDEIYKENIMSQVNTHGTHSQEPGLAITVTGRVRLTDTVMSAIATYGDRQFTISDVTQQVNGWLRDSHEKPVTLVFIHAYILYFVRLGKLTKYGRGQQAKFILVEHSTSPGH